MDRLKRQLHPDERQWAKDKAMDFAAFYERTTGKAISAVATIPDFAIRGTGFALSQTAGRAAQAVVKSSDSQKQ